MIRSFRHKGLKRLFERGDRRGVAAHLAGRIMGRLDAIDAASMPIDLGIPGFDLHELKGDRKGTWSEPISGNWRITFRFEQGDTLEVDLDDYH